MTTRLIVAVVLAAAIQALPVAASAGGCDERAIKVVLAALERASKSAGACEATGTSYSARSCQICWRARDDLRRANRKLKALARACGEAGASEAAIDFDDSAHKLDEASYALRLDLESNCER